MYTKSIVIITLAYIHLSYCTVEANSRISVKPAVDRVVEVIQSVSGVGGPSYTADSNSGYANPAVQQPGSITTNPVTTDGKPEQTSEPYLADRCSCSCGVDDFCQG